MARRDRQVNVAVVGDGKSFVLFEIGTSPYPARPLPIVMDAVVEMFLLVFHPLRKKQQQQYKIGNVYRYRGVYRG